MVVAQMLGDFPRRARVGDVELPRRQRAGCQGLSDGHGASADRAVQIVSPLARVAARLGVAAGAHHRHAERNERVAQRRRLARAESTMPTCGKVSRNAQISCTNSRSGNSKRGANPPAAGRRRGRLTVICAFQHWRSR